MKLSVVLSVQPAGFEAVTFQGDLERNLAKIAGWGYDGVELAIRDPRLVDAEALAGLVAAVEPRSSDGPFRLPVDRVFSMRGFGTVVTGTSVAGRLPLRELGAMLRPT